MCVIKKEEVELCVNGPLLDYMSLGDIPSFVDIEHVDSDYWLVSSLPEKSTSEPMVQERVEVRTSGRSTQLAAPEQRPSFTGLLT